jgi:hypothetical protein
MTQAYNIFKRAYSTYTFHSTVTGTYLDAIETASMIEASNRDGEYLVRKPGEIIQGEMNNCPVQAAWAYL